MGLILDSSAAVSAERRGMNAKQLLESVEAQTADDEIAISVVTLSNWHTALSVQTVWNGATNGSAFWMN